MWALRLKGCQQDVKVWQNVLSVRSLVVSPQQDVNTWLKFSSLCRKSGKFTLSLKILSDLMKFEDPNILLLHQRFDRENSNEMVSAPNDEKECSELQKLKFPIGHEHPDVAFAYAKHLWAAGLKNQAHLQLHELVLHLEKMLTVSGDCTNASFGATLLSPNTNASFGWKSPQGKIKYAHPVLFFFCWMFVWFDGIKLKK